MAVVREGEPLVEVFSVRINDIINGGIFGTIKVTDGLGSQYIYNRGREDFESIRPGGDTLLLTGPARSISAYGSFTINLDLESIASPPNDDDDNDDEFSHGLISWNVFHTNNVYDTPLFDGVTASWGSATVNYVVISDGEDVTVTVRLVDGGAGEGGPVHLYGQISVQSEQFENSESLLFRRSEDEYLDVSPGQLIPLSRSVVSVPINSTVIVRAVLTARNRGEVVEGTAAFPPAARLSGTAHQGKISGNYGEIQVTVT